MHLGGAGIGEADVNAARDKRPHQTFRTVHRSAPVRDLFYPDRKINHSQRVSSKVSETGLRELAVPRLAA
jgi:hypothetical protein